MPDRVAAGQPAAFDGEAVVDLQAGSAGTRGKAVAAVRTLDAVVMLLNRTAGGAGDLCRTGSMSA